MDKGEDFKICKYVYHSYIFIQEKYSRFRGICLYIYKPSRGGTSFVFEHFSPLFD